MEKGAVKGWRVEELHSGLGLKNETRNGGDFPTNSTLVYTIIWFRPQGIGLSSLEPWASQSFWKGG